MPAYSHVVRIPAERLYVLMHPFKRCDEIRHPEVDGIAEFLAVLAEIKMSEDIESVVHGNKDYISPVGKIESFHVLDFHNR